MGAAGLSEMEEALRRERLSLRREDVLSVSQRERNGASEGWISHWLSTQRI